jgi:hypothetical protein
MEHYVNHYNDKGWVHIPNLIGSDVIDVVRTIGISMREEYSKYSSWKGISCAGKFNDTLSEMYTSDTMMDLSKNILGDSVYLFNDQMVMKFPNDNLEFKAHFDNQFGLDNNRGIHTINVSWILDDITIENGSFEIQNLDNKKWCTPVLKTGDVIVIGGNTLHRSYTNKSDSARGLYACVYSDKPIEFTGFYNVPFDSTNKRNIDVK